MQRILLFLFLWCGFFAFSQEKQGVLIGTVTDENGELLIGASVIYRGDVTRGASTDMEGNYKIKLPEGKRQLICRFTDMKTDTIHVHIIADEIVEKNIQLSSHDFVKEFDEVRIERSKFDKGIEDITVSLEVIKPEKLESTNTRNITSALDQTPGLNIMDGEPQIRGGSGFTFGVGSAVTVIVDDIPMMSADAGQPLWDFVPIENIKQIDIIKGAGSVLTGSSSLSGAIQIYTKYPTARPLTKVNAYSGFYNYPKDKNQVWQNNRPSLIEGINFLHSQKFGNWDVTIGGDINYDEGYLGPPELDEYIAQTWPDTISNFTNQQMRSKRARLNFNIRRRSKKLHGLAYGLNGNGMISQTPMVYAWLNDSTGLYKGYPAATFLRNQTIFNLDPFATLSLSSGSKHKLRGRFLYTDNDITANQSNNSQQYYLDYQFSRSYKSLAGLEFTGGLTGNYIDAFAEMYAGNGEPDNTIINVSGYAEIEKKLWKIVTIRAGGRLEYFNLNHGEKKVIKPLFRGSGNIKLYQETYLRASWGQGFRFPTIAERYIQNSVGNFGVFSNPDLNPEQSTNAEIGVKQGVKIGKIYGYLDVAGFWQEYHNTIEYLFGFWDSSAPNGIGAGFKFNNTGHSRVIGIDASFAGKADISKSSTLTFVIGYNYILPKTMNPDYIYATDEFPNQPREYSYNSTSIHPEEQILKYRFLHNVKGDLEYSFKNKISIGATMKYFSKMENMDAVIAEFEEATHAVSTIQNIMYMDYFHNENKGKFIFDARGSYSFSSHHKLTLVFKNMLNKTYSLRPLKVEEPRSIVLQYTFTMD